MTTRRWLEYCMRRLQAGHSKAMSNNPGNACENAGERGACLRDMLNWLITNISVKLIRQISQKGPPLLA